MNNVDLIEKDALQLCLQVMTKEKADKNDNYFSLAMEPGEDTLVYSEPDALLFLEKLGILYGKGGSWLVNNANNHAKGFLVARFDFKKAVQWIEQRNNNLFPIQVKRENFPATWNWFDRSKGIYQFGEKKIKFRGTVGRIFQAFMDVYEKSSVVSVLSIKEHAGLEKLTSEIVRINIGGINKRLRKIGLELHGTGTNGYELINYPLKY